MLELLMPIHQKLVHFPIALFITAFLFQLGGMLFNKESLKVSAWFMYVFSAIVAPVVVLSGLWEANRLHLHHPIVDSHKFWALSTMITAIILSVIIGRLRKNHANGWIIVVLMLVVVIGVTLTGYFGGLIED